MICWQPGWGDFELRDKEGYFLRELQWEIEENPGHPLFGRTLRIIGWRGGYDDFILQILGESGYVYVHLTWHRETDP
ncbi:MAG TPA: hypothetical protein VHB77_10875, partial [Planctomycetaceae bacterium]|nr:hypothetical protein [Planctomycetaceae bacterium]